MADGADATERSDGSRGVGKATGVDGTESDDGDAYSGLLTAIPYAVRASRSWLFRGYVVVGTLAAIVVTVLMALALVVVFGATATDSGGGSLTLSRAFYVVVGLFVVGPMLAPTLLVARRHRREGSTRRYDMALGLAGFAFLGSLYLGLLTSVPPGQQETVGGALAPLVRWLYALPQLAGLAPPVFAAGLIALAHRLTK